MLLSDGQVFCIGNGKVAAYCNGANIEQLFGPYYSMPSVISFRCIENYTFDYERVKESGIVTTKIFHNLEYIGKVTDFTHTKDPVFIRKLSLEREMTFEFSTV